MKICSGDNAKIKTLKIGSKIKLFYRLFNFGKHKKVSQEDRGQENTFKDIPLNQIFSDKFSNDIIVNCSGLIKIDDLSSCKDLVSSDFTIF
jgi:hypothetical protein